jgi:multiple sugar transport system permease protein
MASRASVAPARPPRPLKWRKLLGDGATYALLTLVAVGMLLPFVWMVGTSLKQYAELTIFPPRFFPSVPQWGNYQRAWHYSNAVPFARFFLNSALVASCVTVGQVLTSATAGYAFARLRFPGRNSLFLFYIATLMVPFQVTLVPLYLIMRQLHWTNTYYALIIPGLVSAYGTFLVRQFMVTLPGELEDAARLDGANPPTIFLRIVLPLAKPVLMTLTILSFMASWNSFLWPLIMINTTELRTLPIGLAYFTSVPEATGAPQYQLLMAAATFTMIPTLIVFLLVQRYFVKGIAMTGLKG